MKKTTVIMLALLFTVQTAFAASIDIPKPKEREENQIILQGISDTDRDEKLTLTVFVSGKNYGDITDFGKPTDTVAFAEITKSGENGEFYVEWTPRQSGYYDIYLAGSNGLIKTMNNVYIPADSERLYNAVRTGTSDELKTLFSDEKNRKDLLRSDEVYDKIKNPVQLAAAVYNIREALDDTANTDEYIQTAAHIEILSENKTLPDMDAVFLKLEGLGLELGCKEELEAFGTDLIRTDMASDMGGISEKSFAELDAYVTERLILSGVYKSLNWMDGIEFLNYLEYPEDSTAREKAARAVTGTKYDTISDLKEAIDSAVLPSVSGDTGSAGSTGGGGGGSAGGRGGFSSPSAGQVDVSAGIAVGPMSDVFPDVDSSHYAFDDINYLHWHDVITGDDSGYFYPERPVTRAEAVKMLCCAFGVGSEQEQSFSDVGGESWYFGYVGGAYKNKLVAGGDDGLFRPDEPVTRQDLAVLIMRFAQFYGITFEEQDVRFADIDSISDYARPAVGALCAAGIINGVDAVTFAPDKNADRAQTASMLARCMRSAERSSE